MMPIRPAYGSTTTLMTWPMAWASGSGATSTGVAASPSPLRKRGGIPSAGLGRSFRISRTSSGTPAPVSADTKHTGTRCRLRSAFLEGVMDLVGIQVLPRLQVGLHQGLVHFHDLVHDLGVRVLDAGEVGFPAVLRENTSRTRLPWLLEIDRQAALAENVLNGFQQAREARGFQVDLVDDDQPAQSGIPGRVEKPPDARLDPALGAEYQCCGFHRSQNAVRTA